MHGMLLLVGIYIAQAVLARGPNLIGTSQPVTVSRNPRFWGSREQRIRHVPRMYGHADRFVYRIYTYGFISRLLVASLGALHGMHAPSLDRAFSEACGCPKTPFCGKCTLERPEMVLAYLHNTQISTQARPRPPMASNGDIALLGDGPGGEGQGQREAEWHTASLINAYFMCRVC